MKLFGAFGHSLACSRVWPPLEANSLVYVEREDAPKPVSSQTVAASILYAHSKCFLCSNLSDESLQLASQLLGPK